MEHLEGIEDKVLKLEVSKDVDLVNSIFRPVHTIKGTSSFLGLKDVNELSHKLEFLLDDIRKEKITDITSSIIDTILDGIDKINEMLNNLLLSSKEIDLNDKNETHEIDISDVPYGDIIQRVDEIRGEEQSEDSPPVVLNQKSEETEAKPESKEIDRDKYFPPEMKKQFIFEGEEHIETIENILLKLEEHPEEINLYNDLFRALHSLKGNSGVILSVVESAEVRESHYLNMFKKLSHQAEGIVQKKRDKKEALKDDDVEILLSVNDYLRSILNDFKDGKNESVKTDELLKILKEKTDDKQVPKVDLNKTGASLASAISNSLNQTLDSFEFALKDMRVDSKRNDAIKRLSRNVKNLQKIGKKIKHELLIDKADTAKKIIDFMKKGKDDNEELFIKDLEDTIKELKKKGDRREQSSKKSAASKIPKPPQSATKPDKSNLHQKTAGRIKNQILKISQEKIDIFMNLIGELIISKNSLNSLSREFARTDSKDERGEKVKELSEIISRISDELQDNIMMIRMLPVANAFSKFPRMIRDLSRNLKKKINLEITGAETEIDKNIIEFLSDPLVHMIRNSADHGIEQPEIRRAKGKSETGTIQLKAYNQGQHVVIEVVDDGKGIDAEKVGFKALEKGMVTDTELERMDKASVLNLILAPGFSMAKEVTDVSGRGVGMDVVKSNIEKLGGEVSIISEIDKGSTIFLKLPLTMAIGRGLEVLIGSNTYFIPIEYIIETIKINRDKIFTYKGRLMTVIREELIPVYELSVQLNIREKYNPAIKKHPLVIITIKGQKIGLLVDQYYSESEYVIKALPEGLSDVDGVSGAMITGDGKVHLILDPLKMI
jgi:two-component system chemotaxis sensor kinase CheA